MPYTLPDLDYDYAALEPYYSAEMLELHHDKHHAAYVSGVNDRARPARRRARSDDFEAITGLQKKLAFNLSGHVLHTLLWKNLSPEGGDKPAGRPGRGDRRVLRLVRAVQAAAVGGNRHRAGLGLGRARMGAARRNVSTWRRSTTTRTTSGRARARCWCSTRGSTRTTCSTRTCAPTYVDAIWNVVNWSDVSSRFESAATRRARVEGARLNSARWVQRKYVTASRPRGAHDAQCEARFALDRARSPARLSLRP